MLSCTDKEIFEKEEKLMSKKVKVFISALVVALLLTVGATATVMAEGEEETTPPPEASANGLLERVADILGIDKEDLISAFEQARQEMYEESFINRVNEAVEEGFITQEQADEIIEWWGQRPDDAIREWWGQKPDVVESGMVKRTLRLRASHRFHMQNCPRERFCPRLPVEAD